METDLRKERYAKISAKRLSSIFDVGFLSTHLVEFESIDASVPADSSLTMHQDG